MKITLKPNERMIISGAVIKNGKTKTDLTIENKVPILREKDILNEKKADSPCRRIYFIIQLMYVDESNLKLYHTQYWQEIQHVLEAAPSMLELIDGISDQILHSRYYQALKLTQELIAYEKELLNVRKCI